MEDISLQIFSQILSNEGITINRNSRAETASFDTAQRILFLPVISGNDTEKSKRLDLMYCSHEIGHALYTDQKFIKKHQDDLSDPVFFAYFNIVEDSRIERLVENKFPGVRNFYYDGYKILYSDFDFSLATQFIDRLNIYFKGRNVLFSPVFSQEEAILIEEASEIETIQEVYDFAKKIYDRQSQMYNENLIQDELNKIDEPVYGNQIDNGEETEQNIENNENSQTADKSEDLPTLESPVSYEHETSTINRLLQDSENDLNGSLFKITPNPKIIKPILKPYTKKTEEYVKQIDKLISHMLVEFQQKKASKDYLKTKNSQSGKLDTKRLFSYRIKDNLFRTLEINQDQQNHRIYFLLDWSGSMKEDLAEVVKTLVCLVRFCKLSSIPFDVYQFKGEGELDRSAEELKSSKNYKLVRLSSSNYTNSENFNAIEYLLKNDPNDLASTPICSAMIDLLPVIKARNKNEKAIFTVLTDGMPTDSIFLSGQFSVKFDKTVIHTSKLDLLKTLVQFYRKNDIITIAYGMFRRSDDRDILFLCGDECTDKKYTSDFSDKKYFHIHNDYGFESTFIVSPEVFKNNPKFLLSNFIKQIV